MLDADQGYSVDLTENRIDMIRDWSAALGELASTELRQILLETVQAVEAHKGQTFHEFWQAMQHNKR